MVNSARPPIRMEDMLWFRWGSQKSLTFWYDCSIWLFFVQKEGFFAGSASSRIKAKSSASTQIRPRKSGRMISFCTNDLGRVGVERREPMSQRHAQTFGKLDSERCGDAKLRRVLRRNVA